MQVIPLQAIPNQRFSLTLGNDAYDFRLNTCVNITTLSLMRNQAIILLGERIPPDTPIIPYRYLEAGNFILVTQNGEYPLFSQFGITQFLAFFTQDEIDAIRKNVTTHRQSFN